MGIVVEREFASYWPVGYFIVQLGVLILWRFRPEADRRLSVLSGITLACSAGFRTGGFDYQNYLQIISDVHAVAGKGLLVQLLAAKDPMMLGIVDGCQLFSDGTRPVFLVMSLLAALPKLVAAQKMSGRSAIFMSLYSIFFAPVLEFAAIRASVALGFLILLLAYEGRAIWKITLSFISVFAHISALPILPIRLGNWGFRRSVLAILPLVSAVAFFEASALVWFFPRSIDYRNDVGTINAYIPTVISYLIYVTSNATAPKICGPSFINRANAAAALGIGFGLGLAPVSVAIAYRFMDIGWVFLMIVLILRAEAVPSVKWRLSYQTVALAAFISVIGMSNLKIGVWNLPI